MRKSQTGLKKSAFIEAAQAMGSEKGVSEEALLAALAESFRVTFAKKIEDEFRVEKPSGKSKAKETVKLPDALIRTEIDLKKGKIEVYHQWLVVNDDDVQDDYIEIGLEDAKEKNPKLKVGDYYEEELDFNNLNKVDVNRFVSCFRQKISKAEKDALLVSFENKIGKIVTADVERFDDRKVLIVNLGKTSASLYKSDLIGDEKFQQGDKIKVYVKGFEKDDKKGLVLKVSRSHDNFLKCLFEQEIHEIYDGTVIIKDVKRIPGKRSKVAVYSNDPNVDPSGACIGQNGSRIQAIVSQLGNGGKEKEKIDVITWNPNLGLYLAEILKPGKVLGMNINEEEKTVTAVCEDGTGTFAIGFKGTNVILASKLTDYKVRVLDESQALEEGITYRPLEEFEIEAKEEEKRRFRERQQRMKSIVSSLNPVASEEPVTKVEEPVIEEPVFEEEKPVAQEVEFEEPVIQEVKVETPVEQPVAQEVKAEEKVEEVEKRTVKTTTTLESLEKLLDEEKKSSEKKSTSKKKYKKDDKKSSESEQNSENQDKKPVKKMDIYTEEELQQLDEELENFDDYDEEEEEYSDYDLDEYYEE